MKKWTKVKNDSVCKKCIRQTVFRINNEKIERMYEWVSEEGQTNEWVHLDRNYKITSGSDQCPAGQKVCWWQDTVGPNTYGRTGLADV